MKKLAFLTILLLVFSITKAQDSLRYAPFHLSLFTPLSTNGPESYRTVNDFSLNLFYSGSAGVSGIELGAFANYTRYFVNGVQMAGFTNVLGGKLDGIQMAGFSNFAFSAADGMQMAGFMNLSENMDGIQMAGFMNLTEKLNGMQMAGFMNLAENTDGMQLAGFANISESVKGAQIAGFTNVTEKLNGLQLGFLNFVDSVESGAPIGFLSFVGKGGYSKLDIWADEMAYTNIAFKTGIPEFYNIIGVGTRYDWNSPFAFVSTYGIGREINLNPRLRLNPEILYQQFYGDDFDSDGYWSYSPQLRTIFTYQITERFGIYAGPSIKYLVQDEDLDYFPESIDGLILADSKSGDTRRTLWVGFAAGLSLF